MEIMDIQTAIRWLNESSDSMVVFRKSLELVPKDELDFLKRELTSAKRGLIETALHASMIGAIRISDQMLLELPLLMGHGEDYLALVKAQRRYQAESGEACSVLHKTAPANQTASADPRTAEPGAPVDRQERIKKRFEELMAKSSPPAASTAVAASKSNDSAGEMPSLAPADAAPVLIVDES